MRQRALRDALWKASVPFLTLVRSHLRSGGSDGTVEALAFWCRGLPKCYQAGLWRRIRLRRPRVRHGAASTEAIPRPDARAAWELTRKLIAARQCPVFLMRDASPLAECYREIGGTPLVLSFGRRDLPQPWRVTYAQLFGLVNRAAVAADGNRQRFQRRYAADAARFRSTSIGKTVVHRLEERAGHLLPTLAAAAGQRQTVVVVDTGMQGTLALFVARWFEAALELSPLSIGVRLVAVYPWLSSVFRGSHVSTDSRVVEALEEGVRSGASPL